LYFKENILPELPEVEAFRKYFSQTSLRQKIKSVEIDSPGMVKDIAIRNLQAKLKNKKFISTHRHGKYLFVKSEDGYYLVLHFGMTGDLKYFKSIEEKPKHTRLIINFTNGYHLALDDQRKFGTIRLINDPGKFVEKKNLGPDPLTKDFNENAFLQIFKKNAGTIKSVLMNQKNLSGIGNIYSDEILFHSGIHPGTSIKKLNERRLKNLYVNLEKILKKVINADSDQKNIPHTYLLKHRISGEKCPKCIGKIIRRTIAGRSSYFCAKHQK
jgi:formamidopyrimidine-DNA glycosylase